MVLRSVVDPSTLRVMRAARAARERRAVEKLALLRRLERQKIFHELTEKRVEQSYNEQLFSVVFDYRTLLSHEPGVFHMLPQNFSGKNRYDDFSLGFFGREGDPLVLGSAEFKSPGCDLDKPQTSGRYGGVTPVAQAISAAKAHAACCWAIVSNFCELRLFALNPDREIARANLLAVRSREDLAVLCTHFDRRALLGDGGKELPEMTIGLGDDHPARAFDPLPRFYRVQWLFTPTDERQIPLHEIESRLRAIVDGMPHVGAFFFVDSYRPKPQLDIAIRNGWIVTEGKSTRGAKARLGISRYGQVVLSVLEPVRTNPAQTYQEVEPHFLGLGAVLFGRVVFGIPGTQPVNLGAVEVSLSDMTSDPAKPFEWRDARHGGRKTDQDVIDARWEHCNPKSANDVATAAARCLCELAVHFRSVNGGVLLVLDDEVKQIEPLLT